MSVSFDFEQLTERQRYKLMIGTIIPRPIALVTTVDDPAAVDAIARLGGDTCATIRDRFEMLTPKL
ncbi:hypothetical protein M2310_002233 [Rhizobium leguminosarum]|uniref:Uncharacterized protein n=1 Tax=Rhizobium esperanzae TaxID=1967781 RepID=A0A7W6UJP5_9HYPH|nr:MULTISPECIES: hypothetical protein [Rhizobium]MBB4439484.1 hypothetical protein [Rhizobium esperanzae]MDH6201557.1 hypothetical protein [Rhizobium leguminosarum]